MCLRALFWFVLFAEMFELFSMMSGLFGLFVFVRFVSVCSCVLFRSVLLAVLIDYLFR